MREGAVDDRPRPGDGRERSDVSVRPPPLRAVHEGNRRPDEQHAAGGCGAQRVPQRRHAQAALGRRQRGPGAGPWPQRQRLDAGPRQRPVAHHRKDDREADGAERRDGARHRAALGQPLDRAAEAEPARQHQREPADVEDAVGGKPAQADRLQHEGVERDDEPDGPRQTRDDALGRRAHGPQREDRRRGEREHERQVGRLDRERAPRQRPGLAGARQQRQRPERGEERGDAEPRQRRHNPPPAWRDGDSGEQHEDHGAGQVRGMDEHDRRCQRHDRPRGKRPGALAPAAQRRHDQRQQRPAQPRRRHADVNAALDAAGQPRPERQGQRDERAGQREPRVAEQARQRDEDREAGREIAQPQQRQVGGGHRDRAEREAVQRRARVGERRRIELELRVARPPPEVPRPRRRPQRDHVPEPIELAGMVVERGSRDAEGGRGERGTVADEDQQGSARHESR